VEFLPNAVEAVRAAFDVLDGGPGRVRPDRERFALIGHSAGGNLSAQMAAVAAEQGLPRPKAVVAMFPGEVVAQQEPSFDRIPAETLLVVAAAEQDVVVGDARARQIYAEATSVPSSRKKFVLYRTDRHTSPALVADHFAPSALLTSLDTGEGPFRQVQAGRAGVDILDRYGFWRLADLTLSAAFADLTLDEATDHGAKFRDLGRWGDGQPVTPPIAGDDLSTIPRVIPTYGARLIPWSPNAILRYLENRPRVGGLDSPPHGAVSRASDPS
jgi:acetyl esterase/lipase